MNGTYLPRTDVYAAVPTHYESLMKKYEESLKVRHFFLVIVGLEIRWIEKQQRKRAFPERNFFSALAAED